MATPSRYSPHGTVLAGRYVRRLGRVPSSMLQALGHQLTFCLQVLTAIPHTVRTYRRQMMLILTDITWGSGALVVGGGTVSVLVVLGVAVGASIGIEGFNTLGMVGMEPLTGLSPPMPALANWHRWSRPSASQRRPVAA